MGIYSKHVLPRLLDWAMNDKNLAVLREELLSSAHGTVAEIGFGSGANLPHYPKTVEKLIAIDPSAELLARAKKHLSQFSGNFQQSVGVAESVPLTNASVDCVVSTFTLCSVANTMSVLREVKRILKPGGTFFFLEHGVAPDANIHKWQRRLTPIQKVVCGGCHLDRNIPGLLADACCDIVKMKRLYVKNVPRVFGFVSMGEGQYS